MQRIDFFDHADTLQLYGGKGSKDTITVEWTIHRHEMNEEKRVAESSDSEYE